MKKIITQNLSTFYCTCEEDEWAQIINVFYKEGDGFKKVKFRIKNFNDGSIGVISCGEVIPSETFSGVAQIVENFNHFYNQIKEHELQGI